MKYLSIIIILCFSLNAMASTGTLKELENAIDNYQYAMTVEWDQKDVSFKEGQIDALTAQVDQLFQKGLTVQDLNLLVEKRFNNSKVAETVKMKISLLGNKITPANVAQILKDNSIELYQQGASWNGDAPLYISIGVSIVAIVAILVAYGNWKDKNYVCEQYAIADYCTDSFDCSERYGCNYSGTECGSYERCIKEVRVGI